MEDLRRKLRPGDQVILKDARDMMADEDGMSGTLLDEIDFETIAKLDPYSNKLVTIRDVDETTFGVLERFGADSSYHFFAGDIAVWPDEILGNQINVKDILEFMEVC